MKVYRGYRNPRGYARVTVNDRELPLRLDLSNHSPTGFEWGYGGSGPAQLALAILADYLDDAEALPLYQDFKRDVIAGLGDEWRITGGAIDNWLALRRVRVPA
ncbi:MAG: DUF6166 domain-containing protein [Gammaproteobacteria bacterium]